MYDHAGSRLIFRFLLAALVLSGCENGTEPLPPTERQVATIAVTASAAELRLGETLQLQAALLDATNAAITGRAVAWTAKGPATVDNAGVVTGTGLGEATITATVGLVSDSAKVRVITPVVQNSPVVVGVTHACGISRSNETYCWGNNTYGLLGASTNDDKAHPVPEKVVTGVQFASISSQGGYTCGLTSNGRAYCWGIDIGGSLGTTPTQGCDGEVGPSPCSNVPIGVSTTQTFESIAAFWTHACGLISTGSAYCWGTNNRGQLGIANILNTSSPTRVDTNQQFTELAGSRDHTCGLARDGSVFCWGDNASGQLGIGSIDLAPHPRPLQVAAGSLRFKSISAHGQDQRGHTCGIATDSLTYCWGNNDYGQLGTGNTNTVASPTSVATTLRFVAIETGLNWTCGLTELGKAHCWGAGARGSIPNPPSTCSGRSGSLPCAPRPVAVAPEITFVAIRLGGTSACGVAVDDRAYCWGANDLGKIGNGSTSDAASPVAVAGEHLYPPRF